MQEHRSGGCRDAPVASSNTRRTIGWLGAAALGLGGSNQSLFIIGVLFAGSSGSAGQGSAAIPLLAVGLVTALLAAPGWTELVLLSPQRVGGIAAASIDAFAPYSSVLSAVVGCCYWWGWAPATGLSALFIAQVVHGLVLPAVPVVWLGVALVAIFVALALRGVRAIAQVAIPLAIVSTGFAFVVTFVPIMTGHVDWHLATTFRLKTPFSSPFGSFTSMMAGLYLVSFTAPAFEAAACYAGELRRPNRDLPRALLCSALTATLFFAGVPIVLLGVLGPQALGQNVALELGPALAPLFGSLAKAVAIGFMVTNLVIGILTPLAGAARTLAQLADEGFFPRFLGRRLRNGSPWVATLATALVAVVFLLLDGPIWLVAAATFSYTLALCMVSVAVWLLRRDAPELPRPYRAPRGAIALSLVAAIVWASAATFGFAQFGIVTVIIGIAFMYVGPVLYAWRIVEDRRAQGLRGWPNSLHFHVTAAMSSVLLCDGVGYFYAIAHLSNSNPGMVAALQDIFVLVAFLTVGVGLVVPEMISRSATRELAIVNASLRLNATHLEREIVERKAAQERLLHVVFHDELTGLSNRALFLDRFRQIITRMERDAAYLAAVLFLDVDRFKLVNDSLGHLAGDMLLVAIARRLEGCVRPGDTLARLGGDEFTILLDGIDGDRDAVAVAERILAELRVPFCIEEREMFVSASIGIAVPRSTCDSADDLLRNADIAMYRAKELGKGRYEIFTPELLSRAVALLQLENDLKRALERGEFCLYYQAIVSLDGESLRGFEALIRWEHPQRGLVGPDEFISAAEESGAIIAIGARVLDEACRQARLWQDEFACDPPLVINVNVSAKEFGDSALLEHISDALNAYGLSGNHINLEITESAIMHDLESATATLNALRRLGLRVHLDDFGTGHSSLAYLHRFPIDTLKVDRSFVSVPGVDTLANPEIVRTIASLAQSLGLTTTVEGIETLAQLEHVRRLQCTHAQGYYLSRPLDAPAATALIARRRSPVLATPGVP